LRAYARTERGAFVTTGSIVRADAIRQFYERGDDGMVEVLTDLEADGLLRLRVIELLSLSVS
jgi:hypothetical protein